MYTLSIFFLFLPPTVKSWNSLGAPFIEVVKTKKTKLCELVGVWLWLGFFFFLQEEACPLLCRHVTDDDPFQKK